MKIVRKINKILVNIYAKKWKNENDGFLLFKAKRPKFNRIFLFGLVAAVYIE